MLRIGPSGNSKTFYETGLSHTYEAPKWLKSIGLTVYEYSFGRGINLTDKTAGLIAEEFSKYGIEISAHAPYYINFANQDREMIEKSDGYIINSLFAINKMGGERVVFHPGACGKLSREIAFKTTFENVTSLMQRLKMEIPFDFKLCPETMGKNQQIGRVEEVVSLCAIDERLYPCFDFGHINSYMQGGLKTKEDYRKIIDYTINALGKERASNMHIHFSKIEYGKGGEVRHLTFMDEKFGPDYAPLAQIIDEYNLTPYIVCESKEVMSDDALLMKNMHKNI